MNRNRLALILLLVLAKRHYQSVRDKTRARAAKDMLSFLPKTEVEAVMFKYRGAAGGDMLQFIYEEIIAMWLKDDFSKIAEHLAKAGHCEWSGDLLYLMECKRLNRRVRGNLQLLRPPNP